MTLALAALAFTIALLFSGLVLGAMREAFPARSRQRDLTHGRGASAFARSCDF